MEGRRSLLLPVEAADMLRLSKSALYSAVYRGQIPGVVRVGRRLRFNRAELEALANGEKPRTME